MSTTAITYVGHATTVIQTGGVTLYTDPHFGEKALFRKRKRKLAVTPQELPSPDAILISHAHYDHLDFHSFKYFPSTIPVVVPKGLADLISKFIRNPIVELACGVDFSIRNGVRIHAVPIVHRGGRLSGLRYRESSGYLIEGEGGNIYFAGDTAYDPCLLDIKKYGPVSVALLPIGPCYPKFYMKKRHLSPEDAIQLCAELDAKVMIPIHWGVFRIGIEGATKPLDWLKDRLPHTVLTDRIVILEPGETWSDRGVLSQSGSIDRAQASW